MSDHKPEPRSLVLCSGSMQQVPASNALYVQDLIFEEGSEQEEEPGLF